MPLPSGGQNRAGRNSLAHSDSIRDGQLAIFKNAARLAPVAERAVARRPKTQLPKGPASLKGRQGPNGGHVGPGGKGNSTTQEKTPAPATGNAAEGFDTP